MILHLVIVKPNKHFQNIVWYYRIIKFSLLHKFFISKVKHCRPSNQICIMTSSYTLKCRYRWHSQDYTSISGYFFSKHCFSCIEKIRCTTWLFGGGVECFIFYLFIVIYGITINRRCPVTGTIKCVFITLD